MARNIKPITGCSTPNRGLNSLSPGWITQCTDTTTGTTNPSINSILDNLDKYGQTKNVITVSHTCGTDYVCDGIADQVEIQEAIAYANTTKLPVFIINDGNYNMTAGLTISSISSIVVDFGFSFFYGTGAIPFLTESTTSSINVFRNARIHNFTDAVVAEGAASQYEWFEFTNCTGSGLLSRAGSFNYFKDFYMNPGLTFYGIYAISCHNNTYDNFKIYSTARNSILFQNSANSHKVINSYLSNTQTTNRVIETDGTANTFSNNIIATGTQTAFAPIYSIGFATIMNGNAILHGVVTPTACIELAGSGVGSSITGNVMSGFTSGSFQQVSGATGSTGVSGNAT